MEPASFSDLYTTGLPRTEWFLMSLGYSRDDASENAQAAWGRAWEHLAQLRDTTKIVSWVNKIAMNDARRALRRAKQHVSISTIHERVETLNTAAIDIAGILKLCPLKEREVLETYLEGISTEELAHHHGISPAAMRLRVFRARRTARQACEPRFRVGADINSSAADKQPIPRTVRQAWVTPSRKR